MATPHPMLVHLGCTRIFLSKSVGKEQEHTMASQNYKNKLAIIDRIRKASMHDIEADMRANILNMLQRCAFVETDKMEIMELLTPKPTATQQN